MSLVRLVKPSIDYKEQYFEMIEEWNRSNEKPVPWVLKEDPSDFQAMVNKIAGYSKGIGINEGFVPSSTYWLVSDDYKVLGAVNIRHYLNDRLRHIGGHIGYGIRPGERRKGFATEMLRQALIIAQEMGIYKALITCDKENVASAGTIKNNGGILHSEGTEDGVVFQRYWVDNVRSCNPAIKID